MKSVLLLISYFFSQICQGENEKNVACRKITEKYFVNPIISECCVPEVGQYSPDLAHFTIGKCARFHPRLKCTTLSWMAERAACLCTAESC